MNKSNLTQAGSQTKSNTLAFIEVEGVKFITDGRFRCPAKKESYSLRPFKNPSGQTVVQLDGYRPAAQQSGVFSLADTMLEVASGKTGLRRVRANFESLKAADAERSRLILEDSNSSTTLSLVSTSLSEGEMRAAEAAKLVLSGLPAKGWSGQSWSYLDAANFVAKNFQPCRQPKRLAEAVDEFNHAEQASNLKFATLEGKATTLKRLVKCCPPDIQVHEVPADTIKQLIHSGTKRKTWKKTKSNLNTFFEWAAHEDQAYAPANPIKSIQLRKKYDDYRVPKILTNEEVFDLLSKAQDFKGGRLFLFCVVGIVVALRPAEMARVQAMRKVLGQESLHFGDTPDEQRISVIGKTRHLRQAVIPPEFVPLIKSYVDAGYPIIPRNFAHDWTLLRAQAGFLGRRDLLPAHLFSDKLQPWTSDVLRHVGITHQLNRTQDETATALWAGDSPAMIFRHYKGKATREDTRRFYAIAGRLKLPALEELKQAGVPDQATDSELIRFKCPVDNPNTFFLDAKAFHQARKLFLERCPEAAAPEFKGPRRGKGMWSKRRMLKLPKQQDELIRLVWENPLGVLAQRFKVAKSTLALALHEAGLPPHLSPPKGHWQQRSAGGLIALPDEVQKVFPNGLPPSVKPVGRQIRLKRPGLAVFLRMVWEMKADDIADQLKWSKSTVEREIRRWHLPRPEPTYWLKPIEQRQPPATVKQLLGLDSVALKATLGKSGQTSRHEQCIERT
jgi:site-specific recombinase XerD